MSNSKLVCYTRISPFSSKRTAKIDKITIHHMAGNLSIESCGAVFQTRHGSSNYGVGTDGRIGMYVEESRRAWTSSNWENDNRAVTIEVANDGGAPDWHVSDTALESTIKLCVDICQRNGIKKLNFTGDKTGNLTMHKYFAYTQCPGKYLGSKFPYIAEEVNKRLGVTSDTVIEEEKKDTTSNGLSVGDTVNLISGAKYTSGKSVPSWVIKKTLYVRGIDGDKITVSIFKSGAITGTVPLKYIKTENEKVSTNTSSNVSGNISSTTSASTSGYTLTQFVKDVQKACGAGVDGVAGAQTLSKTVTLSASKNAAHAAVKPVQKRLYALGYTQVGSADGVAGSKFTAAVKAFQKANGCVQDGEITAKGKTWKKLLGM